MNINKLSDLAGLCMNILGDLSGILYLHLEDNFGSTKNMLLNQFHYYLLLMNNLDLSGNLFFHRCHYRKYLNIDNIIVFVCKTGIGNLLLNRICNLFLFVVNLYK